MTELTLAPPLDGVWTPVPGEARDLLAERVRDFDALPRAMTLGAIQVRKLPFYSEVILGDAQTLGSDGPGAMLGFLYGRDGVRPLTGRSDVIHDLNARLPPDLGDRAAQETYLKFFCGFVHGDDGPFEILLSGDQIAPDETPTQPIAPPAFHEATGLWTTTVLYGAALFDADFSVGADGNVKMERDAVISERVTRSPQLVFDGAARHRKGPSHDA